MKAKNNNLRMASISRIACLAWKRRTQTNEKAKLKEINHKPKDKLCYVMNFRVFFLFVCFFADSKFNFWANKYCWHCHFLLVSMLHTLHTLRILMVGLYWSLSSEHHKKNHLLFSAHGNPASTPTVEREDRVPTVPIEMGNFWRRWWCIQVDFSQ